MFTMIVGQQCWAPMQTVQIHSKLLAKTIKQLIAQSSVGLPEAHFEHVVEATNINPCKRSKHVGQHVELVLHRCTMLFSNLLSLE